MEGKEGVDESRDQPLRKFRGRKWSMDKIKEEELFITKADKGGAILIMNF